MKTRKQRSCSSKQNTSLTCQTVHIGTYIFTPKKEVCISPAGFKVIAPSLHDKSKYVELQIEMKHIVKSLVYFGETLPLIFLYNYNKCGTYVRQLLKMKENEDPYYDPLSDIESYKRITLLPECISEQSKATLRTLLGPKMYKLNGYEANHLFERIWPEESNDNRHIQSSSSSISVVSVSGSLNAGGTQQILIFPAEQGGIPIRIEDYLCLAQGELLNDVIIDFYLQYLLEFVIPKEKREKTHIFSSFFYNRLTAESNESSNRQKLDNALTPAQQRHERVKNWTKNVHIFDKEYIVVPINENSHWFVAIICHPNLFGCLDIVFNGLQEIKQPKYKIDLTSELDDKDYNICNGGGSDTNLHNDTDSHGGLEELKHIEIPVIIKRQLPFILIFDSIHGQSRSNVANNLRDYLTCEYQAKVSHHVVINKDHIKAFCPEVPRQNNLTDCGLYLLQYVEQFFIKPVDDFCRPNRQLLSWFDEIAVIKKREEISNAIKNLIKLHNPGSRLTLPIIKLPTFNGNLNGTEIYENGSDSNKGNSNKLKRKSTMQPTGLPTPKSNKMCDLSDTECLPRRSRRKK